MAFFLNPSLSPQGTPDDNTVTVYTSMLEQAETLYSQDGFLSPADLQKLAQMARGFAAKLDTPSKRASLQTKATQYDRQASQLTSKDTDISVLNKQSEDDSRKLGIMLGNNPKEYLANKIKSLTAQITLLDERMQGANESGDIASQVAYANQYNQVNTELQQWVAAKKGFDTGDKSGLQAYAITDPNTGQPIQIEYVPVGLNSIKGAKATNLTVDDIPLFLVPNKKSQGAISAKFMGQDLSAPDLGDVPYYDPAQKRLVMPAPLTAGDGKPQNIPGERLLIKNYLGAGEYGVGIDGKTLYKNVDGDHYTKIINMKPEDLGLDSTQFLKLPAPWERRITPLVTNIVDGMNLPQPEGFNVTPQSTLSVSKQPNNPLGPISMSEEPALNIQGSGLSLQGSGPGAIQQPQGAELQQQNTQEITGGGLFKNLVTAGKKIFNKLGF